ncbi:MAG: Co2+/Mg2+ efflux protein ApaG [Tolumonas sp.]|uniref:Co2+/Mg2+ efflux protein ApaG n=1 Tax=uncultured Tolumonas sp. TaxID=263765 RepID=UPI002A0A9ECB|nr:Co2+/Mg2+ efflux protein ApaG [uncultured Tolumonas sp.]MDD2342977.1 Co2+/Mg2+ efflux protein ApaG [Tolumonas sp.]MDD2842041.1 Co2+/Mg2+ efflux protein ApaG [Tolumonas sp.]
MPGIQITPRPFYLAEQSDPDDALYAFGYEITIHNQSGEDVQLMDRHWLINDANGQQTEVQGQGVVGQQPIIAAGQSYTYQSNIQLKTPFGCMRGSYTFQNKYNEQLFEVSIPPFALAIPHLIN